ncbi:Bug family tripartite tricarboxylate transporter substrate binding protein [Desulfovibrio sp. SGI.169]|uniref:Bug family tripartite tricarboxylate transporter substrate binding protein n=1 Tax=Desulfovibrio sp. SGI.169 TaxID=3420561 RepID=UPI003CFCF0B9
MKKLLTVLAACFLLMNVSPVMAAEYPIRPVSVIVPFAAGGGTDVQARLMLKYMEEQLGKSMVIVNRPGAGGEIGMTQLSKSHPDGYTLGVIAYPDSYIRSGYMKTAYDNRDYIYIGTSVNSPVTFLAGPGSACKTLDDLIARYKETGKAITVGVASDAHYLAAKLFAEKSGVKVTPIFFKSGSAASTALMGGHVDTQATNVQFAVVGAASGAHVLAIAGDRRIAALPDAKTFKEQGYDVILKQSRILVAPKGTPVKIVALLEKTLRTALGNNELQEKIAKVGDVFEPMCGKELEAMLRDTEARLDPALKKFGKELVSGQN